jgi:hypothetical protein
VKDDVRHQLADHQNGVINERVHPVPLKVNCNEEASVLHVARFAGPLLIMVPLHLGHGCGNPSVRRKVRPGPQQGLDDGTAQFRVNA